MRIAWIVLSLTACGELGSNKLNDDKDGDGYSEFEGDCDDNNAALTPADQDGDGASSCDGDCDDADAFFNANDADRDGVSSCEGDCDDSDAASTNRATDADCDGTIAAQDCDDDDATSNIKATDGDCDGVLTANDCDDNDATSNIVRDDADCDGILTADDCNDNDASSTAVAQDTDCDGVNDGLDCEPTDASIPAEDGDCDGTRTADDCDDSDPSSTVVANDADCDGTITTEDCDDGNPDFGAVASDADCDGAPTSLDCDDSDATLGAFSGDRDCDGIPSADDCDDSDASTVDDMDCDGVTTSLDCDDDDAGSTIVAEDADCDGTVAAADCDDSDAASTTVPIDGDCDGVLTADDCDDSDASMNFDDDDGDGYATCDGDCNDDDPTFHPDAADGFITDKNCDGIAGTGGSLGDAAYTFVGAAEYDEAAVAVAAAGDVDGDGIGDILIAGYHTRAAYLVPGSSLGSSTTIDLSEADYTFRGIFSTGWALASAGDVDGDGLDDILIGVQGDSAGGYWAGAAHLILGSSLGSSSTIDLADSDYKFVGEYGCIDWGLCSDYAGAAVASAGDVDGDGLDDIIIGAEQYGGAMDATGAAYVILGSSLGHSSTIDLSDADYKLIGEDWGDFFEFAGSAVSSAGDVDGDGLDDILIGATGAGDGSTGPGVWRSPPGVVSLILGSSLGSSAIVDLSDADYKFIGEGENDWAGSAVAPAGDFDGDGLDDFLIGAFQNDYSGSAYLVLGSSLGSSTTRNLSTADVKFVGEYGSRVGEAFSNVGDIDGDAIPDFLFGGPQADTLDEYSSEGAAYLVLGSTIGSSSTIDLSTEAIRFAGETEGDRAGNRVAFVDDLNGDDLDELLIGAPDHDDSLSYRGAAYMILSEGRFTLSEVGGSGSD